MANKINFSDYPASGVYFMEIDNSIISTSSSRSALRLAVGFNMRGPFNRPVYVASADDCNKFFGPIDRKLERNGCFTNRMVRTLVRKAPVYVLNLLKVDSTDTVGCAFLPLTKEMGTGEFKTPYSNLYDKTSFWVADDDAFVKESFVEGTSYEGVFAEDSSIEVTELEKAPFFAIGNCGTKDISVIVKKSEGLAGYNVTFLEYFGSQDEIPYKWINPNDYVSDYFVDVVAINGKWDSSVLSNDVVWGKYFDENGLKADMFNKFIRLDAVNVIKQWTGCVLPNFQDKQGTIKSIDYVINAKCNETGLMFGVNEDALDYVAYDGDGYFYDEDRTGVRPENAEDANFVPDFIGNEIASDSSAFYHMSAYVNPSEMITTVTCEEDSSLASNEFKLSETNSSTVFVGDYVKSTSGRLSKITKKKGIKSEDSSSFVYFATEPVDKTNNNVEVHKNISSVTKSYKFFVLDGLKIGKTHIPSKEEGVEKIYSMLSGEYDENGKLIGDLGIRKGLLNNDAIDFRYIVDTMAYGLGENCGGKRHLANFAKEKEHCTAIINAPSMSQFASSDAPVFSDEKDGSFDISYIPQGGNQDLVYSPDTKLFSLPDEDNGATHVGVFAPFLKYADRNKVILVPPAADVANTFMNKFMGGDPYVTVANLNGIIVNSDVVGVEYQFDENDRGYLETMGINPIIDRSGQIMIYGDKTGYQSVKSDLSYLHVRELLNTIQIACGAVLEDYVFTYNIPTTRAEIVTRINPILKAMKSSGALVKYEIQCDDANNDKEVIDNKFCIVDIGVWISQNMEKIIVPITINRSTTA